MRGRAVKCVKHPMNDAMAVCPSCGRGICDICWVNVFNVPYCKECAEWIIIQMAKTSEKKLKLKPLRIPIPKGIPKREFFIFGAIGALIMIFGTIYLGYFTWEADYTVRSYPQTFIFCSIIFSMGLLILGIGFYGFYRNYGSTMGLISSVFLGISSVLFPALIFFSVREFHPSYWDYWDGYRIMPEYFLTAIILFGICLALMGVTFLLVKDYTMTRGLAKATGIFNIIASSLFLSVILAVISGLAWFLLIIGCIMMAVVFPMAKTPPEYVGSLHPLYDGIHHNKTLNMLNAKKPQLPKILQKTFYLSFALNSHV